MCTAFTLQMLTPYIWGMGEATGPATRSYHHGDLRGALVRAGLELAARGGASAVTLRAATRLAGVSPTAAYRHFASHEELQYAVGALALADLARTIEGCQAEAVAADSRTPPADACSGSGTGTSGSPWTRPGPSTSRCSACSP